MSARITWYRFHVLLLVLWLIVVIVDARPERLYKSCGQPLSIRISRVCSGKYYGKWRSYNNFNLLLKLDMTLLQLLPAKDVECAVGSWMTAARIDVQTLM